LEIETDEERIRERKMSSIFGDEKVEGTIS
jgi:hypothetical protein